MQLNLASCLISHVFLPSFLLYNGHFSSSKLMISSFCLSSWSMSPNSLISSFNPFLIFQNLKWFNLDVLWRTNHIEYVPLEHIFWLQSLPMIKLQTCTTKLGSLVVTNTLGLKFSFFDLVVIRCLFALCDLVVDIETILEFNKLACWSMVFSSNKIDSPWNLFRV